MSCPNCPKPEVGCTNGVEITPPRERTVGEVLNDGIREARERVESLCVLKARLEALNVLEHPVELYQKVAFI